MYRSTRCTPVVMEREHILGQYGLFETNVPRYTSYPPANRFGPDAGRRYVSSWLDAVPAGEDVSLYIHIPFCRRLCWFCACRTQGTRSLRPLSLYMETLLTEISRVRDNLQDGVRMSRLHLGGGTPTLLTPDMMAELLWAVFGAFPMAPNFEFSVEIDPTEADPDLLDLLAEFGVDRVSIGVQDFAQDVQAAIGREQSFEETRAVVDKVREGGAQSLNFDLLYGLPHQTEESLAGTLDQVVALSPDRIALYGYAHVPWVSKRQALIPSDALPNPRSRFRLASFADRTLLEAGYQAVGFDHFAKPGDRLARAAREGRLTRGFQGYSDDPASVLIGLGASAISRFPQGYSQNAVSTSAYQQRIGSGDLAAARGFALSGRDRLLSAMIQSLLCRCMIDREEIAAMFPDMSRMSAGLINGLAGQFGPVIAEDGPKLFVKEGYRALLRIMAAYLDREPLDQRAFSAAI